MEIDIHFGVSVMELDQLIRRALQDHFLDIQPPATVWGSIRRQLVNMRQGLPISLTRGLQSEETSTPTRRSDHG